MTLESLKQDFLDQKIDKWTYIDEMYRIHSILFDYAAFMNGTNIGKVEICEGEVVMTFRDSGVRFVCTHNDKRLAPLDALNFGGYEAEELAMQFKLADAASHILDVGGNYGWYALHMAKKHQDAQVYSFEPVPHSFQCLKRNIALNGVSNVKTFDFALSDRAGSFPFYYEPTLSVNASLRNVSGNPKIREITCSTKTMDQFCLSHGVRADFIKCDVEGAELLVFKGAAQVLMQDKPVIFTEMLRKWTAEFDYHPNDIIDFLTGFGYRCFTLSGGKLRPFAQVDGETAETNYFFLHMQKHADKLAQYSVNAQ